MFFERRHRADRIEEVAGVDHHRAAHRGPEAAQVYRSNPGPFGHQHNRIGRPSRGVWIGAAVEWRQIETLVQAREWIEGGDGGAPSDQALDDLHGGRAPQGAGPGLVGEPEHAHPKPSKRTVEPPQPVFHQAGAGFVDGDHGVHQGGGAPCAPPKLLPFAGSAPEGVRAY